MTGTPAPRRTLGATKLTLVACAAAAAILAACSDTPPNNEQAPPPPQAYNPPPNSPYRPPSNPGGHGGGQHPSAAIPVQAAAAGFTRNTFSTRLNFNPGTVDTGLTYEHGYQWYVWNFFANHPTFATSRLNSDQSISVGTMAGTANATLVSAAKTSYPPYFVGQAFGGGGYFEAEISFDADAVDYRTGVPAWWMMALEHLAQLPGQQWPGQAPGYSHYIEVDTLEYNRKPTVPSSYGGTLIDWYGIYKSTCPASGYCKAVTPFGISTKHVPQGTDWKHQSHKIGVLWVPATDSRPGSFTFYFDNQQEGDPVSYTKFTNQQPPPNVDKPWTFGVADQQHMVLILGTGASTPMIVRSVNVWQASTADNMVN